MYLNFHVTLAQQPLFFSDTDLIKVENHFTVLSLDPLQCWHLLDKFISVCLVATDESHLHDGHATGFLLGVSAMQSVLHTVMPLASFLVYLQCNQSYTWSCHSLPSWCTCNAISLIHDHATCFLLGLQRNQSYTRSCHSPPSWFIRSTISLIRGHATRLLLCVSAAQSVLYAVMPLASFLVYLQRNQSYTRSCHSPPSWCICNAISLIHSYATRLLLGVSATQSVLYEFMPLASFLVYLQRNQSYTRSCHSPPSWCICNAISLIRGHATRLLGVSAMQSVLYEFMPLASFLVYLQHNQSYTPSCHWLPSRCTCNTISLIHGHATRFLLGVSATQSVLYTVMSLASFLVYLQRNQSYTRSCHLLTSWCICNIISLIPGHATRFLLGVSATQSVLYMVMPLASFLVYLQHNQSYTWSCHLLPSWRICNTISLIHGHATHFLLGVSATQSVLYTVMPLASFLVYLQHNQSYTRSCH